MSLRIKTDRLHCFTSFPFIDWVSFEIFIYGQHCTNLRIQLRHVKT